MQLVIDRGKWRKGKLYDSETDTYCAVGSFLEQCGVPRELYSGESYISSAVRAHPKFVSMNDKGFYYNATYINDDEDNFEDVRERRLAAYFLTQGVVVQFIGTYK